MKRIALFPGTFDPITIGHLDIIQRAIPIFDKLIIGIGRNANKTAMFSEELRLQWVNEIFKNEPQVSAIIYEGLTVECCRLFAVCHIAVQLHSPVYRARVHDYNFFIQTIQKLFIDPVHKVVFAQRRE